MLKQKIKHKYIHSVILHSHEAVTGHWSLTALRFFVPFTLHLETMLRHTAVINKKSNATSGFRRLASKSLKRKPARLLRENVIKILLGGKWQAGNLWECPLDFVKRKFWRELRSRPMFDRCVTLHLKLACRRRPDLSIFFHLWFFALRPTTIRMPSIGCLEAEYNTTMKKSWNIIIMIITLSFYLQS